MTQPAVGGGAVATNPCHGCGAVDDHPRHTVIRSFVDDAQNSIKHLDCCAAEGCDQCPADLSGADGKKGPDLRAHLVAKGEATGPVDLNEGLGA